MPLSKTKFILSVPLALISIKLYLGIMAGYLFAFFVAGKGTGEQGKWRSVVLNLGARYQFHFHHWMMGASLIPLVLHYDVVVLSTTIGTGFLGGVVFQGVTCYSDWYRIFKKK